MISFNSSDHPPALAYIQWWGCKENIKNIKTTTDHPLSTAVVSSSCTSSTYGVPGDNRKKKQSHSNHHSMQSEFIVSLSHWKHLYFATALFWRLITRSIDNFNFFCIFFWLAVFSSRLLLFDDCCVALSLNNFGFVTRFFKKNLVFRWPRFCFDTCAMLLHTICLCANQKRILSDDTSASTRVQQIYKNS